MEKFHRYDDYPDEEIFKRNDVVFLRIKDSSGNNKVGINYVFIPGYKSIGQIDYNLIDELSEFISEMD